MIQNRETVARVLILYQGRSQFQQNQAAPARSPRATDKCNLEFARPRIEYFRRAGERIRLSLPLASSSKGLFTLAPQLHPIARFDAGGNVKH